MSHHTLLGREFARALEILIPEAEFRRMNSFLVFVEE